MLKKSVWVFVLFLALCATYVKAEPDAFTYYPPGHLIKGSAAFKASTGLLDYEVHAFDILFPIKDPPAFANSQVFSPGGAHYAGTDGTKGWADPRNYTYPWRDNFCEERSDANHSAKLCPSGWAHQGQDIRPIDRKGGVHEVVAVMDGLKVWWANPGDLALITRDKNLIFNYLHMAPPTEMVNGVKKEVKFKIGQPIVKGRVIGYVSNVARDPTSVHLHFGILKKKKDENGKPIDDNVGYAYVHPYWSLVLAYQRLIGSEGTPVATPTVCTPKTTRCASAYTGVYDKAALLTCSDDGTFETLSWCAKATCGTATSCEKGTTGPPDMSASYPSPDLAPACHAASCTCGCDGARCKPQLCTPGVIAYCSGNNAVTCPGNGCTGLSSVTCPAGYACSGGNCYPGTTPDMSTGPRDMAVSKPPDMAGTMPKPEVCNGIDDDGNGIIDDPTSCWQWVTRFKDPITGARCYGIGTTAPFACAAYDREFVLFVVPTVAWSDGSNAPWVQCSRGIDHVLTKKNGTERMSLEALGWNCSLELGYFFDPGSGPRAPKRTPFANTCPLYRQRFMPAGSQSHLFTPFNESVAGAACELPARADVVSITGCGVPPGC